MPRKTRPCTSYSSIVRAAQHEAKENGFVLPVQACDPHHWLVCDTAASDMVGRWVNGNSTRQPQRMQPGSAVISYGYYVRRSAGTALCHKTLQMPFRWITSRCILWIGLPSRVLARIRPAASSSQPPNPPRCSLTSNVERHKDVLRTCQTPYCSRPFFGHPAYNHRRSDVGAYVEIREWADDMAWTAAILWQLRGQFIDLEPQRGKINSYSALPSLTHPAGNSPINHSCFKHHLSKDPIKSPTNRAPQI